MAEGDMRTYNKGLHAAGIELLLRDEIDNDRLYI
jgi:hypothetical protein